MTEFFSLTTTPSGIAHLVLNRPERMNTMSPAFFPALRNAVWVQVRWDGLHNGWRFKKRCAA